MTDQDRSGDQVFRVEEMRAAAADAYKQTFFPSPQRPPAVGRANCLYHYTSTAGLLGILQSGVLRATDTAFLNDSQEIAFAAEPLVARMFESALEIARSYTNGGHIPLTKDGDVDVEKWSPSSLNLELDTPAGKKFTALLQTHAMLKYYASPYRETVIEMNYSYIDGTTFVACLSEEHDDLGQWRGYGQGGYAIGFSREHLADLAPVVSRVEYGDAAVDRLVDRILEHFNERNPETEQVPGLDAYVEAVSFCLPQIALVKHAAFALEKEWRLVVPRYSGDYSNVKVLARGQDLVPYVDCKFPAPAVAEIVIGPGGDFHSVRAVRALLQQHGYDTSEVCITQSSAPFKG